LTDQAGDGVDRFLPFSLGTALAVPEKQKKIDVLCKNSAVEKKTEPQYHGGIQNEQTDRL
jgi:hypothetical protein